MIGTIAVWFSSGAASAAALKLTVEKYGADCVRAVNNPIANEHPDNRRFLADVSDWVGIEIEDAKNPKFPSADCVDVWDKRKAMSIIVPGKGAIAPCTDVLKKEARYEWESKNKVDWHVLGFTIEEEKRHKRFVMTERENVLPILIDAGMTKIDCWDMIRAAGLRLPKPYELGYPNANCIGCVKATSPTYWNLVRQTHPEVFSERAEQSRRLGSRLVRVKGERIFLDELDPDAKGRPLKSMPDCGLFCEEWSSKDDTCDWGDDCGDVVTNLDGDNLCQKHADEWVKGEGNG
jgi:3'-phosphoadenosine 5'-phosphosulfate sulfotransferase (PAPS reductase)/FAD synthetase